MTKNLPWTGRFALFLFLPVGILPFVYSSDQHARVNRALPNDPSGPVARPTLVPVEQRSPRISDWTTRYTAYPRSGFSRELEALQNDPRARMRWHELEQRDTAFRLNQFQQRSYLQFGLRNPIRRLPIRQSTLPQRDWSISLGSAGMAPSMFPAKYGFNVNSTPNCTNDFVVFTVNTGSTNGQPNIVAFNNLYSGPATGFFGQPTGICASRNTTGKTDTKSSATVMWSYNVHSINPTGTGGAVPTSPSLSFDGTKVAFVESATGNPAHFHVLAWKSGDGQVNNLQTTTSGKEITTAATAAPAAGSGAFTDLALGTSTDTNSSPYIDFANDTAYVGNDAGSLFRIKNVFCTLPTCGTAIPSLDSTWGTGGVVATGCAGKLTGPVQDFPSLNVYVGCSDGKVYGFNSVGTPLPNSPLVVGNGSATGGIVDPPIVDAGNAVIYAAAGTGASPNTGSAVVVQAQRDLSGARVATIGPGGQFNIHSPAFNDPYYTSTTNTSWILYAASLVLSKGAYDVNLFGMTFDAGRNMQTGTPGNSYDYGTIEGEYAPLTEFKNGSTDQLFFGLLLSSGTALNLGNFNINSFPSTTPPGVGEGNGPSGMIVDNSSTSAQASSIYFGVQGSNTAVKLTQAGLN